MELKNCDVKICVRIPVVPGVNDTEEDILKIVDLMGDFGNLERIELLPLHKLGRAKYLALGIDYPADGIPVPDTAKIELLRRYTVG